MGACASAAALPVAIDATSASTVIAVFMSILSLRFTASIARGRQALQLLQPLHSLERLERLVVDARGVEAAALLEGKLRQGQKETLELLLHRHEEPDIVRIPADVHAGLAGRPLVGISAQVDDHRPARHFANRGGDVADLRGEVDLPVVPANGVQLATLAEVEDLLARSLLDLALEVRQEVVAVGVDL